MSLYNLNAVALVVGPDIISSFATDGAVEIAKAEDVSSTATGASGETAISVLNSPWWDMTIQLMETGEASRRLWAQYEAQQASWDAGTEAPIPVRLEDPINGDLFDGDGYFKTLPSMSKAREVGSRTFVLSVRANTVKFAQNIGN